MKRSLGLILLLSLAATAPVHADEVATAISAAQAAYTSGNYTAAIEALDAASRLVRRVRSEQVAELLPPAPAGWSVQESAGPSASSALLGGMVSAQREYRHADGGAVLVQIQSDSPMLQSVAMLFSNPMMMTASGAKLEELNDQKLAVTYRIAEQIGDVKAVVDKRYLVSIEGRGVSREDLLAFAQSIGFERLRALK